MSRIQQAATLASDHLYRSGVRLGSQLWFGFFSFLFANLHAKNPISAPSGGSFLHRNNHAPASSR